MNIPLYLVSIWIGFAEAALFLMQMAIMKRTRQSDYSTLPSRFWLGAVMFYLVNILVVFVFLWAVVFPSGGSAFVAMLFFGLGVALHLLFRNCCGDDLQ